VNSYAGFLEDKVDGTGIDLCRQHEVRCIGFVRQREYGVRKAPEGKTPKRWVPAGNEAPSPRHRPSITWDQLAELHVAGDTPTSAIRAMVKRLEMPPQWLQSGWRISTHLENTELCSSTIQVMAKREIHVHVL